MEIIKIIGLAVAALCMYAAGFLYIHKKKIRTIYPLKRKEKVFVGITVLVILTLSVTLVYGFAETNSFLHNMRLLLLYGIICPIAFIDYYDKIIPNKLLLFSAFVWLITVGIELFVDSSNVYNDFKSSIIAMAAIFVIGIVCKVLVKNSVGMGDIKLFMIMGLFYFLACCFFRCLRYVVDKKEKPKRYNFIWTIYFNWNYDFNVFNRSVRK